MAAQDTPAFNVPVRNINRGERVSIISQAQAKNQADENRQSRFCRYACFVSSFMGLVAGAAAYTAVSGVNPQNYGQADTYDPNTQNTLIGGGAAIAGALLTLAAAKACRALRNRAVVQQDPTAQQQIRVEDFVQDRSKPKSEGKEGQRLKLEKIPGWDEHVEKNLVGDSNQFTINEDDSNALAEVELSPTSELVAIYPSKSSENA